MRGIKCLVLGGAGFIGTHLTKSLIKRGAAVTVVDDLSNSGPDVPSGCEFIQADISECSLLGYDYIFNLACKNILECWQNPQRDLMVNAMGTLSLLIKLDKRSKFIQASSVSVETYLSPYAVSKYAAEMYCKLFNTVLHKDVRIIRYSNVYGPGQKDGLMAKLIRGAKEGAMQIYGDGEQTRDFVYVDDAVSATLCLALDPSPPPVVTVGTGEGVRVVDVARVIQQYLGGELKFVEERLIDNIRHRHVRNTYYRCRFNVKEGIDAYIKTV